ncbi:MAG: FAD-binding domain-containing protein [Saprospiraceae bacterium]
MDALPTVNILWFKRDLRLDDHPPLAAAIDSGLPLFLCYAFEPDIYALEEHDERHWRFALQSLREMEERLAAFGARLYILHANMLEALERLSVHYRICTIYAHQETGMERTFARDKAIKDFCRKKGVAWREWDQDGVRRGAQTREGWKTRYEAMLETPLAQPDLRRLRALTLPDALARALCARPLPASWLAPAPDFQPGGETYARRYLDDFLYKRSAHYTRHISKPEESRRSCSRLSPYLAYGCLSTRQVWQASGRAIASGIHAAALRNFQSRLWWRGHFIQKLESDHRMERLDVNRAFASLPRGQDERLFDAWRAGLTGFPMVDACMRCLARTGYVNFRMRAMLATFWSFTLWQDWRMGARYLAQVFLDFEPGIHYSQWQMQSGTNGYGTLRIYNPMTQSERHDPEGVFVRRWVPELQAVPAPLIYRPWAMSPLEQTWYGCVIGRDYPAPIVNFEEATRQNKDRYWSFRNSEAVQSLLPGVFRRLCQSKDEGIPQ